MSLGPSSRLQGASAHPGQLSLVRPFRRWPAPGSHAASGGRRAPIPTEAPAPGHERCYTTCSFRPRNCPSKVARIPKHVRHLGSSRCFLSHCGREGRVGPKMGDTFQPTRDKEVTSQPCAWGKGIRHSRGGRSPPPSPHQGTPSAPLPLILYSGSWRVWVQGRLTAPSV